MKKVLSFVSSDVFQTVRESVIDGMCQVIPLITASYNNRDDDSIFINGFNRHNVKESDTGEIGENAALLIDLTDEDSVNEAINALLSENGESILECNTFCQTAFFLSMVHALPEDSFFELFEDTCDNYNFLIRPLNCDPINVNEKFHVFEDFFYNIHLRHKTNVSELPRGIQRGDVIYVENYDNYPTDGNGPFSGEWCIVTNASNEDDPKIFGFGIGEHKYSQVVKLLHDSFLDEVSFLGKGNRRRPKRPQGQIGVSEFFRLKH